MAITHTKLGRTTQLFLNHIDWPSPLQLLLVVQYIVVIVASSLLCRGIRPNLFGQEAQGLEWLPCPHTLLLAIGQGLFADLAHHEQIWWQSPFKFLLLPPSRFLDPKRYCIQCVQNGDNHFSHFLRSNLPTPEKRPKVHFALFLQTRISTNEADVSSSFTACFYPSSLKFNKNVTR